jgi:carboxyl-terminal processing protease
MTSSSLAFLRRLLGVGILAAYTLPLLAADNDTPDRSPTPYDWLITKVVANKLEQQHYAHPTIGDEESERIYEDYFSRLDPNRYFFLESDIKEFEKDRLLLDDRLKDGKLDFAFNVYNRFIQRVAGRLEYTKKRVNEPFDFSKDEEMLIDRKEAPWAKNTAELDEAWRKRLKNQMLIEILAREMPDEEKDDEKDKSVVDDLKPSDRIVRRYQTYYNYISDNDKYDIMEMYLSTVAKLFDPHSAYLNYRAKEDFDIQMKLALQGIGATLQSDNGYTKVVSLVPGGPADTDGRLKSGDLIIAVGQGAETPEDVIDIPLNKVVRKIRGEKGKEVRLTVVKTTTGVPKVISIIRDEVKLKEQEAKGETREVTLSDGTTTSVGIIDLPSFYADFKALQAKDPNAKSTSRDVKMLIEKMVKEDQISGIIIDLRNNGGGSLTEAIKLSGLFIPEGPVVQVQRRLPVARRGNAFDWAMRVKVEKDRDRGEMYDLPLVVLTNRLSASASEIFAGCIQDYGRGIVVGDTTTHGKGSVQTIQDLDRSHPLLAKHKPGAVKYTMGKFYRVTGASTQQRGVKPDIVFPSFLDHMDLGESRLKNVMPWDEISAQEITDELPQIGSYLAGLREKSDARLKASEKFQHLKKDIAHYGERREQMKTVTLNKEKRIAIRKDDEYWAKRSEEVLGSADDDKQDAEDGEKKEKRPDLYLDETLAILGDLVVASGFEGGARQAATEKK